LHFRAHCPLRIREHCPLRIGEHCPLHIGEHCPLRIEHCIGCPGCWSSRPVWGRPAPPRPTTRLPPSGPATPQIQFAKITNTICKIHKYSSGRAPGAGGGAATGRAPPPPPPPPRGPPPTTATDPSSAPGPAQSRLLTMEISWTEKGFLKVY
jgi:hypothetical protein